MVQAFTRALELAQCVEDSPELFPMIWGLAEFTLTRKEYKTTRQLAERLLRLAHISGDVAMQTRAHALMGCLLSFLGESLPALEHFNAGLACYDADASRNLDRSHGAFSYAPEVGVLCLGWGANILGQLGYLDQSLERLQRALALAQELTPLPPQTSALIGAAWTHWHRGEPESTQQLVEEIMALPPKPWSPKLATATKLLRSWALVEKGQVDEGLSFWRYSQASTIGQQTERLISANFMLETYLHEKAGRPEQGLRVLDQWQDTIQKTGEHEAEPELHRLKGALLLAAGEDETLAEACFQQALEVARKQQTKLWELRAAMSLCRLWQKQGKREQAQELLAGVYNWFTEGFDTRDLRDAKALLEELG
jgi:tetratricopeptide (TPR) repeat protein